MVEKDNVSLQQGIIHAVDTFLSAKEVPIHHHQQQDNVVSVSLVEVNIDHNLLSQEDVVLVQTDKDGTKVDVQEDNTMLGN